MNRRAVGVVAVGAALTFLAGCRSPDPSWDGIARAVAPAEDRAELPDLFPAGGRHGLRPEDVLPRLSAGPGVAQILRKSDRREELDRDPLAADGAAVSRWVPVRPPAAGREIAPEAGDQTSRLLAKGDLPAAVRAATTAEPSVKLPDVPAAPPKELPAIPGPPPAVIVAPGPIEVGGVPVPFDTLSRLVDGGCAPGGGCTSCGGGGCAGCGGRPCAPGRQPCEPFPARTCVGRFIGLVYENVCCPDPCYQPRWEAITAAAFFADAPRPVSQTRVRWDYGHRLTFPDRGEFFWARADGNGKGPTPNSPALGIPYLDYHELFLDTEVATGAAGVTVSVPYRSVNPTPFAGSGAGFSDMSVTAKSLLWDSELFLFAFQFRTYIPIGNFRKGLGVGHVSLEPGLIAGIRATPETYLVAQVAEWIPLGGDPDYMGAALRFNLSINQLLWRPVKDVQLIGTLELVGIGFQDGAFTDPVDGPLQKLSGQTILSLGPGLRLFYCDKFDIGAAGSFGITGKYLVRELMRFEVRYRY
jgi:hypothetical protein